MKDVSLESTSAEIAALLLPSSVLTQPQFRDHRDAVLAEIKSRVQTYAEAQVAKLGGLTNLGAVDDALADTFHSLDRAAGSLMAVNAQIESIKQAYEFLSLDSLKTQPPQKPFPPAPADSPAQVRKHFARGREE